MADDVPPVVRVWVAVPREEGMFSRTKEIPLSAAPAYVKAGYVAIVDPFDQEALLRWENEQKEP